MNIKNLFKDPKTNWKYIIILAVFSAIIGGGVFLFYQYWWMPKNEVNISEKIIKVEQEVAKDTIIKFMNARIDRDVNIAKSYLSDNGKQSYSQIQFIDFALVGISNPHYDRFKILETKEINKNEFRFKVRIYEKYQNQGDIQYFDETLTVIKINKKYFINSVRIGNYVNIKNVDEENWKTYKNEEYGFEIKYPKNWTYQKEILQPQNFGVRTTFQDAKEEFVLSISNPIPGTGFIGFEIIKQEEIPIKNTTKFFKKTIFYFPENNDYLIFAQWNKNDWKNSGQITFRYQDKSNPNLIIFNQILSTFKFLEPVFILPKIGDQWKIGEKHIIEINQPIKNSSTHFTHLTLNKLNGEEIGVVYCKIGTLEKTSFDWNTKLVLNYCGAGLEGKTKKIEPGIYIIAITKDMKGRPIIASSDPFLIISE